MLGKCKDCKFWNVDYINVCSRVGYADIDLDDSAFDLSYGADDDQGCYARLYTGPNFGCFKFKAKWRKIVMKNEIKREDCYRATDNTSFPIKEEAEHYQKKLDFMKDIKTLIPEAQRIFDKQSPDVLIGELINGHSYDIGNFEELLYYLTITYLEVPELLKFFKFVEKRFNDYNNLGG